MLSSVFKSDTVIDIKFEIMSDNEKDEILKLIDSIALEETKDAEDDKRYQAYSKLRWLSAFKDTKYKKAKDLYEQNIKVTGGRAPDHPQYSTYISTGWATNESPISKEELIKMPGDEVVKFLRDFKQADEFKGPSVEGLSRLLQEYIESNPEVATSLLAEIESLNYQYISSIYDALAKSWSAKKITPYSIGLQSLRKLICSDKFKNDLKEDIGKVKWAVSSAISFIASGSSDDDNSYDEKSIVICKEVLIELIPLVEPDEGFVISSDYFTRAINETRGKIWEALILLVLRECRLLHIEKKEFSEKWKTLEAVIEKELLLKESKDLSLLSMIGRYYRQFLFMNDEWLYNNFQNFLPSGDENQTRRLSFMDGLAYVTVYIPKVYEKLKEYDVLLEYLRFDDDERDRRQQTRVIDLAILAKMYNDDSDILLDVVAKKDPKEWSSAFNSISSIVRSAKDEDLSTKAMDIVKLFLEEYKKSPKHLSKEHIQSLDNTLSVIKGDDQAINEVVKITAEHLEAPWELNDLVEYIHSLIPLNPERASELFVLSVRSSKVLPSYPEDKIVEICKKMEELKHDRELREVCERYSDEFLNGGILSDFCK